MILYVNKFTLSLNGKKYIKGDSIDVDETLGNKLISENSDMFIKVAKTNPLKENITKTNTVKENKTSVQNNDGGLPEIDVKKTIKRVTKK